MFCEWNSVVVWGPGHGSSSAGMTPFQGDIGDKITQTHTHSEGQETGTQQQGSRRKIVH